LVNPKKHLYMKKNISLKSFSIAALFLLMIACKPDHQEHYDSPAWHIQVSEKLVIPAAVELPGSHPGNSTRVATFYAEGVQKYKAKEKPGSDPVSYEWAFVAPQADLFDITNKKVGTHSAGPAWQLFENKGSIYAQHFSPAKTAPSPDPASIDWLLLMPKEGTTPTGVFGNVAYIQRIATQGGKAPSTAPTKATDTVDVKYTAVYRFTKKH
jgi:hypothetical protein